MNSIYTGDLVEVFELSANLYFRKGDLDTRKQCNSAYIVGPASVTIMDVPTMEAAEEMIAEVRELFGKPIRNIVLTHNHGDHARGLPRFRSEPVAVYCSHRYLTEVAALFEGGPAHLCGIHGQADMMLEGLPVTLFTFEETAHSRGDLFVHLPNEGVLCTGDTVGDPRTLYFQDADPERWVHNIAGLARWGAPRILPGHGDIYPPAIIGETVRFLRNLIQAAWECLTPLPSVFLDGFDLPGVTSAAAEKEIPSLDTLAEAFFQSGSPLAAAILEKAGEKQARREMRMLMRCLVRARLR